MIKGTPKMQDFRHQYTPPVISEDNMIAEYDGNDDEYLGQPQAVPAGHALQWLSDAWLLFEPTRVFRRQFILSHATLADSSNRR